MRTLGVLLRKELHATFTSPVAWVVSAVYLLVAGYTFSLSLFFSKVANLTYIFHQIYILLVLLVPVITMRAFAEERKADTLELLLTAPIREIWIVLAKYLSTMALVGGLLALAVGVQRLGGLANVVLAGVARRRKREGIEIPAGHVALPGNAFLEADAVRLTYRESLVTSMG